MVRWSAILAGLLWHIVLTPGGWVSSLRAHQTKCDGTAATRAAAEEVLAGNASASQDTFAWAVGSYSAVLPGRTAEVATQRIELPAFKAPTPLPTLSSLRHWADKLPVMMRTTTAWLQTMALEVSGRHPVHRPADGFASQASATPWGSKGFSALQEEAASMHHTSSMSAGGMIGVGAILCGLACCLSMSLSGSMTPVQAEQEAISSSSCESEGPARNVGKRVRKAFSRKTEQFTTAHRSFFTRAKKQSSSKGDDASSDEKDAKHHRGGHRQAHEDST